MKVSHLIKSKRKELGYSVKYVVEKLLENGIDVSEKTIYGWESGHRQPDADTFMTLCSIYQITNLSNEISAFNNDVTFTDTEQNHIKKYRTLDEHGKMLVDNVLDIEYKRVTSKNKGTVTIPIAARGGRKEITLSEEDYRSFLSDIEKSINGEFPDIFDRREDK